MNHKLIRREAACGGETRNNESYFNLLGDDEHKFKTDTFTHSSNSTTNKFQINEGICRPIKKSHKDMGGQIIGNIDISTIKKNVDNIKRVASHNEDDLLFIGAHHQKSSHDKTGDSFNN